MPNTAIDDDDNVASLLETRKAICEFLSGFLEQNHLLLKLIHFQVFIIQLFYKKHISWKDFEPLQKLYSTLIYTPIIIFRVIIHGSYP